MHISEIDPLDEALTHRFWEIGRQADEQGRPWSSYWSWQAARAAYTSPSSSWQKILLAAFDGETMLGGAEISLPQLDNTHLALLELYVDPAHQRRGVGSALVGEALEAVAGQGRSVVTTEVASSTAGPASPGLRLARSAGFRAGLIHDMKIVDLLETMALWQPILDETSAVAAGYTLRSWKGACPDDLVEGYCALRSSYTEEAPTGNLDIGTEVWDEKRVREKEDRFRRAGRIEATTVAVAPDGEVVGVTEVMLSEHVPDRGFQGGTIVGVAHRGRRLGLRLKVANHMLVREEFPACRTLLTGNADVNVAMNTVNDRLGYRTVEQVHEMQKRLETR